MTDTMTDEKALGLVRWLLNGSDATPPPPDVTLEQAYDHIAARLKAAQEPVAEVPDRHIAVPVVLTALAVSEIKDMLESEYDMYSIQARPLWASLLTIVAKISLDDQIAIDEQARAESYRARLMAKAGV